MTRQARSAYAVLRAGHPPHWEEMESFEADALRGLLADPKYLLPKYFYDAEGMSLFAQITHTPEYYLTRTELGILRDNKIILRDLLPSRACLVEFGSGSAEKVRALISAKPDLALYVPIDISRDMIRANCAAFMRSHPELLVRPVLADFTRGATLPGEAAGHPLIGFFPGSTIGNFSPPESRRLLKLFATFLGPGSHLIVGTDLVKDPDCLNAAYNDAAGITARFNLNILARLQRDLGAVLDLNAFRHEAVFNAALSRVEMRLRSVRAQTIRIGKHTIGFSAGESIYTESCYKFTIDGFRALAEASGWHTRCTLTDSKQMFAVHILSLPASDQGPYTRAIGRPT